MKRTHCLWICLVAVVCVTGSVLAAGAPSTDAAIDAATVELDPASAVETAVQTSAETGLPESVLVEMSRIPVPDLRICPAYCTGTNLTYLGIEDCFLEGYLAACKIFRNNSTGSRCASVCYYY